MKQTHATFADSAGMRRNKIRSTLQSRAMVGVTVFQDCNKPSSSVKSSEFQVFCDFERFYCGSNRKIVVVILC